MPCRPGGFDHHLPASDRQSLEEHVGGLFVPEDSPLNGCIGNPASDPARQIQTGRYRALQLLQLRTLGGLRDGLVGRVSGICVFQSFSLKKELWWQLSQYLHVRSVSRLPIPRSFVEEIFCRLRFPLVSTYKSPPLPQKRSPVREKWYLWRT